MSEAVCGEQRAGPAARSLRASSCTFVHTRSTWCLRCGWPCFQMSPRISSI